jgi:hypothetical protein
MGSVQPESAEEDEKDSPSASNDLDDKKNSQSFVQNPLSSLPTTKEICEVFSAILPLDARRK